MTASFIVLKIREISKQKYYIPISLSTSCFIFESMYGIELKQNIIDSKYFISLVREYYL